MRVLVVEDDKVLRDGLVRYLGEKGYSVSIATNGDEVDAVLKNETFAIVILDIGLPGYDGFEVLRRMRQRPVYVPVLILTARDSLEDRVHGLDLGADDYLPKPFALTELEARIRAVVRRREASRETKLVFGSLTIDIDAKRTWLNEAPLRLTGREWAILEFLVLRAGQMVRKEQIVAAISNWDLEASPNSVEVHISRLRSKLGTAALQIHSIRGFGYYLEKHTDSSN